MTYAGRPGLLRASSRKPAGSERVEEQPDGAWAVRSVPGAAATKTYRCPGCDHEIALGLAHVVAWRTDALGAAAGAEERRHWHSACWRARSRRSGRPTRKRRPRT